MKKADWFILIVVIAIIVAIGIWAFMSSSEELEKKDEEAKKTKLESLNDRLKAIQQKIDDEIETLRLTAEMEQFLHRKIGRIFLFVKAVFLLLFSGTVYLFIYNGSDILAALFNTLAIASFIAIAIPFLFLTKFLDANALITTIREKIREWIYIK